MIRSLLDVQIAVLIAAIGWATGFESHCDGQHRKTPTAPDSEPIRRLRPRTSSSNGGSSNPKC